MREIASNASDLASYAERPDDVRPAGVLIIRAIISEYREPIAARKQRRSFRTSLTIAVFVAFCVVTTPIWQMVRPASSSSSELHTTQTRAPVIALVPVTNVKPSSSAQGFRRKYSPIAIHRSHQHFAYTHAPQTLSSVHTKSPPLPITKSASPKHLLIAAHSGSIMKHRALAESSLQATKSKTSIAAAHVPAGLSQPILHHAILAPKISGLSLSSTHVAQGYGTTLCIRTAHARSLYVSGVGTLTPNTLACRRLVPDTTTSYKIWLLGRSGQTLERTITIYVDPSVD